MIKASVLNTFSESPKSHRLKAPPIKEKGTVSKMIKGSIKLSKITASKR